MSWMNWIAYAIGWSLMVVVGGAMASLLLLGFLDFAYRRMHAAYEFTTFLHMRRGKHWKAKWAKVQAYDAQTKADPIEQITHARGWNPLEAGESMTIGHEGKVYNITRAPDDVNFEDRPRSPAAEFNVEPSDKGWMEKSF